MGRSIRPVLNRISISLASIPGPSQIPDSWIWLFFFLVRGCARRENLRTEAGRKAITVRGAVAASQLPKRIRLEKYDNLSSKHRGALCVIAVHVQWRSPIVRMQEARDHGQTAAGAVAA